MPSSDQASTCSPNGCDWSLEHQPCAPLSWVDGTMTPSERHDWLVKQGADRYVETYTKIMDYMSQGGRTPGITFPSKAELRALYEKTTTGYWQQLARQNPEEAQSQLQQFKSVSQ